MTRINFYEVQGDFDATLTLACRLTEKAFRQGIETLLFCAERNEAEQLSTRLWQFSDTSFLPHQLDSKDHKGSSNSYLQASLPIGISWGKDAPEHHGLLINLATETPDWFGRFETLAEIVNSVPSQREHKRQRYRFYRDRGYPLAYHNLATSGQAKSKHSEHNGVA